MSSEKNTNTGLNENKQAGQPQKKKMGGFPIFLIVVSGVLLVCIIIISIWAGTGHSIDFDDLAVYSNNDFGNWNSFDDEGMDAADADLLEELYAEKINAIEQALIENEISDAEYNQKLEEINEWYSTEETWVNGGGYSNDIGLKQEVKGVFSADESLFSKTVSADQINSLKIKVMRPEIIFEENNENVIKIDGYSKTDGTLNLEYYLKETDGVLQFYENKSKGSYILKISLPKKALDQVDLNTVKSNINIDHLNCSRLNLRTVKGDIQMQVDAKRIAVSAVSGNININAKNTDWIQIESVDSNVELYQDALNPNTNIQTVQGNIHLKFPKDASFELDVRSVGSDLVINQEKKTINKKLSYSETFGNGEGTVSMQSVSGNIEIEFDQEPKAEPKATENNNKPAENDIATAS